MSGQIYDAYEKARRAGQSSEQAWQTATGSSGSSNAAGSSGSSGAAGSAASANGSSTSKTTPQWVNVGGGRMSYSSYLKRGQSTYDKYRDEYLANTGNSHTDSYLGRSYVDMSSYDIAKSEASGLEKAIAELDRQYQDALKSYSNARMSGTTTGTEYKQQMDAIEEQLRAARLDLEVANSFIGEVDDYQNASEAWKQVKASGKTSVQWLTDALNDYDTASQTLQDMLNAQKEGQKTAKNLQGSHSSRIDASEIQQDALENVSIPTDEEIEAARQAKANAETMLRYAQMFMGEDIASIQGIAGRGEMQSGWTTAGQIPDRGTQAITADNPFLTQDASVAWGLTANNHDSIKAMADSGNSAIKDQMISGLYQNELDYYNYLLATSGQIAADRYLEFMTDEISYRQANARFQEIAKQEGLRRKASEFAWNVGSGVNSGLDSIQAGLERAGVSEPSPYRSSEADYIASLIQEDSIRRNGGEPSAYTYALQAAQSLGNMAPYMLAGGLGGRVLGGAVMGLQTTGGTLRELDTGDYADRDVLLTALSEGIFAVGSQGLYGGLSKLGGTLTHSTVKDLMSKIRNPIARSLTHLGISQMSESAQELFENKMSTFFRNNILGQDESYAFSDEDLDTVIITALTTAMLEGGGAIGAGIQAHRENRLRGALKDAVSQPGSVTQADPSATSDGANAAISSDEQLALSAMQQILAAKRINNTVANEIIGSPQLSAAFTQLTGVPLAGTVKQQRDAIQGTHRSLRQLQAMQAASAEQQQAPQVAQPEQAVAAEEAPVIQEQPSVPGLSEAELEQRRAGFNNAAVLNSGYDSYLRGIVRSGFTPAKANEIARDPVLRSEWERLTGITIPTGSNTKARNAILASANVLLAATENIPEVPYISHENRHLLDTQPEQREPDMIDMLLGNTGDSDVQAEQAPLAQAEQASQVQQTVPPQQRQPDNIDILLGNTGDTTAAQAGQTAPAQQATPATPQQRTRTMLASQLSTGRINDSFAEAIATKPEYVAAFEELTGIKLEGDLDTRKRTVMLVAKQAATGLRTLDPSISLAEGAGAQGTSENIETSPTTLESNTAQPERLNPAETSAAPTRPVVHGSDPSLTSFKERREALERIVENYPSLYRSNATELVELYDGRMGYDEYYHLMIQAANDIANGADSRALVSRYRGLLNGKQLNAALEAGKELRAKMTADQMAKNEPDTIDMMLGNVPQESRAPDMIDMFIGNVSSEQNLQSADADSIINTDNNGGIGGSLNDGRSQSSYGENTKNDSPIDSLESYGIGADIAERILSVVDEALFSNGISSAKRHSKLLDNYLSNILGSQWQLVQRAEQRELDEYDVFSELRSSLAMLPGDEERITAVEDAYAELSDAAAVNGQMSLLDRLEKAFLFGKRKMTLQDLVENIDYFDDWNAHQVATVLDNFDANSQFAWMELHTKLMSFLAANESPLMGAAQNALSNSGLVSADSFDGKPFDPRSASDYRLEANQMLGVLADSLTRAQESGSSNEDIFGLRFAKKVGSEREPDNIDILLGGLNNDRGAGEGGTGPVLQQANGRGNSGLVKTEGRQHSAGGASEENRDISRRVRGGRTGNGQNNTEILQLGSGRDGHRVLKNTPGAATGVLRNARPFDPRRIGAEIPNGVHEVTDLTNDELATVSWVKRHAVGANVNVYVLSGPIIHSGSDRTYGLCHISGDEADIILCRGRKDMPNIATHEVIHESIAVAVDGSHNSLHRARNELQSMMQRDGRGELFDRLENYFHRAFYEVGRKSASENIDSSGMSPYELEAAIAEAASDRVINEMLAYTATRGSKKIPDECVFYARNALLSQGIVQPGFFDFIESFENASSKSESTSNGSKSIFSVADPLFGEKYEDTAPTNANTPETPKQQEQQGPHSGVGSVVGDEGWTRGPVVRSNWGERRRISSSEAVDVTSDSHIYDPSDVDRTLSQVLDKDTVVFNLLENEDFIRAFEEAYPGELRGTTEEQTNIILTKSQEIRERNLSELTWGKPMRVGSTLTNDAKNNNGVDIPSSVQLPDLNDVKGVLMEPLDRDTVVFTLLESEDFVNAFEKAYPGELRGTIEQQVNTILNKSYIMRERAWEEEGDYITEHYEPTLADEAFLNSLSRMSDGSVSDDYRPDSDHADLPTPPTSRYHPTPEEEADYSWFRQQDEPRLKRRIEYDVEGTYGMDNASRLSAASERLDSLSLNAEEYQKKREVTKDGLGRDAKLPEAKRILGIASRVCEGKANVQELAAAYHELNNPDISTSGSYLYFEDIAHALDVAAANERRALKAAEAEDVNVGKDAILEEEKTDLGDAESPNDGKDLVYAIERLAHEAETLSRAKSTNTAIKEELESVALGKLYGPVRDRRKVPKFITGLLDMQYTPDHLLKWLGGFRPDRCKEAYSLADEATRHNAEHKTLRANGQSFFTALRGHRDFKRFSEDKQKITVKGTEITAQEAISVLASLRSAEAENGEYSLATLDGIFLDRTDKFGRSIALWENYTSKMAKATDGPVSFSEEDIAHNLEEINAIRAEIESKLPDIAKQYYTAMDEMFAFYEPMLSTAAKRTNGVELETVEPGMYFPLRWAMGDTTNWDLEQSMQSRFASLGFMQERTRKGGGEMMISPVGNVVDSYIQNASRYIAWSEFAKRLSHMEKAIGDTQAISEIASRMLGRDVGVGIQRYIENLGQWQTGVKKKSLFERSFERILSNVQYSVITGKLTTALPQLSSVWAANGIISPQAIMKSYGSLLTGKNVDTNNPLIMDRRSGNMDPSLTDAMRNASSSIQRIVKKTPGLNKLVDVVSFADNVAIKQLYAACYYDVQMQNPDLEKSGKELFDLMVEEKFTEALLFSQSDSDSMNNAEMFRDRHVFTRALAAFRNQPNKQFNMVATALAEYNAAKGTKKEKEATGKLKSIVAGQIASAASFAVFKTASNFMLHKLYGLVDDDDDDNETAVDEILISMLSEFTSTLAGTVWFGDNVADVFLDKITGGEMGNDYGMQVNVLNQIYNTVSDAGELISKIGNGQPPLEAIKNMALSMSDVIGIPTRGAYDFVNAIGMWGYEIYRHLNGEEGLTDESSLLRVADNYLKEQNTIHDAMRVDYIDLLLGKVPESYDEVVRLHEADDLPNVLPSDTPESITYGDDEYDLSASDQKSYEKTYLDVFFDLVDNATKSDMYQSMDDATRAKFMREAEDYAQSEAERSFLEGQGVEYESDWDKAAELDDPMEYMLFKDSWSSATKGDEPDYDAVDMLLNAYSTLSPEAKELLDDNSRYSRVDDIHEAVQNGIELEQWYSVYEEFQKIKEKDDASYDFSGHDAATELAVYVDKRTDLNDDQKALLKEQLRYWINIPGEAESYDGYRAIGLSPDSAVHISQTLSALPILEDHKGVLLWQKTHAICYDDVLTDDEKYACLYKIITAKSKIAYLNEATRYGLTPEQCYERYFAG